MAGRGLIGKHLALPHAGTCALTPVMSQGRCAWRLAIGCSRRECGSGTGARTKPDVDRQPDAIDEIA